MVDFLNIWFCKTIHFWRERNYISETKKKKGGKRRIKRRQKHTYENEYHIASNAEKAHKKKYGFEENINLYQSLVRHLQNRQLKHVVDPPPFKCVARKA